MGDEVESIEYQPVESAAKQTQEVVKQRWKNEALHDVAPVKYEPPTREQKARAIRTQVKEAVQNVRVERVAESAGSSALGLAQRLMGARKNNEGQLVRGETHYFKYAKARKGKRGARQTNPRARYIKQQMGNMRSHVINPDRRRTGPQSESEYNDNLPQHFGATEDWRATSSARMFDTFGFGSPIASSRNKIPRFWDKPAGVKKKRDGMFVRGVFG